MARQRVQSEPALKSWDEVDAALKQIAECQYLIGEQEIEMNRQINEIKDNADLLSRPMRDKVKTLEQHIKVFVDDHRGEIKGKSKRMVFGETGYRISSKVMIPSVADTIARIKALGFNACLNIKESINKDAVRQLIPDDILRIGAHIKQTDEFWYEVDRTALDTPKE